MNDFLTDIRERVKRGGSRTIIFPEAKDSRILEAVALLKECGVEAIVTTTIEEGAAGELEKLLLQVRAHKVGMPDELTKEKAHELSRDPLVYSMSLLRSGKADALIAGAVYATRDVLRAALWLIGTAPGIKTVSSSFYMVVPPFRGGEQEVLTFADCGVVPEPTAEQLADIGIAAADARKFIVGDEPRVAFLSYSTKESGGKGDSIQRVREAIRLTEKKRPDLRIAKDELQVDAALIASVAERKASGDSVAGKANVLIFPSLDSANIAYKLVERLVPGARAIGPILHGLGANAVVHDLSRGATVEDIVQSGLIAALRSKN